MSFFVRKHTFKTLKIVSFSKSKVASKSYFWRWLLEMAYQIFLTPQLFLSGLKKFPRPHVPVFKSNLPVHTYPTRIWIRPSTQDSSGNISNRACDEVAILEYSIHDKELGSILLRHWIKNYRDSASTRFRIHSGLKNLRTRMPNSPDTCGLKP